MFLKTAAGELEHRRAKRTREIETTIDTIIAEVGDRHDNILEFGSGKGFQIRPLERLGSVTATDLLMSDEIRAMPGVRFIPCSIADAPFEDGAFDLLFSNHVIEHIEELSKAFAEMLRIGKPSCVYAFSVPTNVWLLSSVPVQYLVRLQRLFRLTPKRSNPSRRVQRPPRSPRKRSVWKWLMPHGHGVKSDFVECYRYFKISSWRALFEEHGFEIIRVKPLLLYGPSEAPLIPTMRPLGSLCSSVLFLMRKRAIDPRSGSAAHHGPR